MQLRSLFKENQSIVVSEKDTNLLLDFLLLGPSGLQPNVNLAPITVHDSDSEDEEESMATSRSCITNSIAQSYSDGEEKVRDPVEIQEPLGESVCLFHACRENKMLCAIKHMSMNESS